MIEISVVLYVLISIGHIIHVVLSSDILMTL